jgi:ornithine carbamoyltransferase
MQKKDFLTLFEFPPEELRAIIELALKLKDGRGISEKRLLEGKTAVLIFEKPSLRTRVTFETAIYELGGLPISLSSDAVGLDTRESVEDVARAISGVAHLIVARTFRHESVVRLANSCNIPVINALTDAAHPCQALAFGLTLREALPNESLNVLFAGDGNTVCRSIMVLCAKLGHKVTVAGPKGYGPHRETTEKCKKICAETGGEIIITDDIRGAVKDADAIYTDVWTSMGQEAEAEARKRVFPPYQVNAALIAEAPQNVIISHCLPAKRGEEITDEALDSPNSVAFIEAENRLHVQKAVITRLFS